MKATAVIAAVLASVSVNAAVIQQVIVRQQWPWSTDIKVEYKLAEVTAPVDISVRAFNGDTEITTPNLVAAITGDLYGISESGIGQLVIDPVKAFGNQKVLQLREIGCLKLRSKHLEPRGFYLGINHIKKPL